MTLRDDFKWLQCRGSPYRSGSCQLGKVHVFFNNQTANPVNLVVFRGAVLVQRGWKGWILCTQWTILS